LLLLLLSCSTGSGGPAAEEEPRAPTPRELGKLERQRDAYPDSLRAHVDLGTGYYEAARAALDAGNQELYVENLRKAQDEFLAGVRIEPTSPRPHTWLGIVAAYQGDLKASLIAFRNALDLNLRLPREYRDGTFYSNLAHIYVYVGDFAAARRYLDLAIKTGAPQDELDRIGVLLAWKEKDMTEARDAFSNAAILSERFATTWDDAPLPKRLETFADFAAACCRNPTCGPHMENACKQERQEVARPNLSAQTREQLLELEAEKQKQLREIYQRRRDVDITIDEPNAPPEKAAPKPSPPPKTPSK
jgi:tetratricopeptide (TPR) repeat protein